MRSVTLTIISLLICIFVLTVNPGAASTLERRQDRGRQPPKLRKTYARPPSVGAPPKVPPLPQKLTLQKSPSFRDWLPGLKKHSASAGTTAPIHNGKPWSWKEKKWDRWQGEVLKHVKALG